MCNSLCENNEEWVWENAMTEPAGKGNNSKALSDSVTNWLSNIMHMVLKYYNEFCDIVNFI